MTQFHKQTFESRLGMMGDTAEAVFDTVHPKHHKLGLNRPPFGMSGMSAAMRYTPDRQLRDRFVEVMGIGRDRTLKMKTEKFDALFQWTWIGPVDLFVFDQKEGTYYQAPLKEWFVRAQATGFTDTFSNDGKQYIGLHAEHFPVGPTPVPEVPRES